MKFARSPIPTIAELEEMSAGAFFDGMASAFTLMPTDPPPIKLGISAQEALRADYLAIAGDFRRALDSILKEHAKEHPPTSQDD